MPSAIGLTTALMTSPNETTYGTPVTTDRGLEFDSETLERGQEIVQSSSLRAGPPNLRRGSRRVNTSNWASGGIDLEVVTNGLGRIFQAVLGGTSTIAQQGGTAAWLQTHQLGSVQGRSLTLQKQLRDEANTVVQAFTYAGCKFPSAEFKIDKKGKLMLSLTVDAQSESTATAAAAPTYPVAKTFHFRQGALSIGGSGAAIVQSASIKFDRALDTDRFSLGNNGLKREPVTNDFPEVTGTLSAEFDSMTNYNLFVNDTPAALVLTFTGDLIAGAFNELLRITIPEVHLTGSTPKVGGPELVLIDHPFEGQYDGTNAGIKLEYQTTDTAF